MYTFIERHGEKQLVYGVQGQKRENGRDAEEVCSGEWGLWKSCITLIKKEPSCIASVTVMVSRPGVQIVIQW